MLHPITRRPAGPGRFLRLTGAVLGVLLCGAAGPAAEGPKASEKPRAKPLPVEIQPEALTLAPGAPLSQRALVTRPKALPGVRAWTLETHRHRGFLRAMAVSPDGRTLAVVSLDSTVRLWDVDTGRFSRALVGHDMSVNDLAWSPDGRTLATCGDNCGTVKLWDVKSGRPLRTLRGHPGAVVHADWSPNGRRLLVSGGTSGFVWLWDAVGGQPIHKAELGAGLPAQAWSPDGRTALISCRGKLLYLWDAAKGKVARNLGDAGDEYEGVAWSPDGQAVAACGKAKVTVWEAESGKPLRALEVKAHSVAWSPDGKTLATAGIPEANRVVQLWDAESGKPLRTLEGQADVLEWTEDGTGLAGLARNAVLWWEFPSGKLARTFAIGGEANPLWSWNRPLITGYGESKLTFWDTASGKPLDWEVPVRLESPAWAAWSPDGKSLATAAGDQAVHLWDAASGKPLRAWKGHTGRVIAIAWAPDGKLLASASADKTVRFWPATGDASSLTLEGHGATVSALAWSPDGRQLATGGDDRTVRVWNAQTGKPVHKISTEAAPYALAWSPDGKTLAASFERNTMKFWDAPSGKLVRTLENFNGDNHQLAWAPAGGLLACANTYYAMHVWDGKAGKLLYRVAPYAAVNRVSWVPGGAVVASSDSDRTVSFWDAPTGQFRGALIVEERQLLSVSVEGHYRTGPEGDGEVVYVVQTEDGQNTLTPKEFAAKYRWRNLPQSVRLTGK